MANFVLPGYETIFGSKKMLIIDHTGPASYANTGTYATSGDVINASDFGMGGIDMVIPSDSNDGTDEIMVSFPLNSGQSVPKVALHWFVIGTSTEEANTTVLSGKSVRLIVIGV